MQGERAKPSFGLTAAWVIALAVVLGATGEALGGLIGALLGYVIAQILHLRGEVARLHGRMQGLETERSAPSRARAAAPASTATSAQEAAASAPVVTATPAATAPVPARAATAPAPGIVPPRTPLPPAPPTAFDRALADAFAWLKRGNPLARVGIVVLFFGGAFLAKYSADRGLFPIEFRFMALALGSIALLVLGWRMRGRRRGFAQILQGGGVAGFYLTVFAAMRLYHLVPQSLALALLVVVAITAAVLAVAQNALALAVIGTAGGFLAPILVSTGGGNHVALFSYYTVLNVGVFAVAWFRAWRVLNLVGFVFTFGVAGAFRATAYSPDKLVSTDFFLLLFFVLYVAVSILFALRQKPDLKGYVSGSLVFGLPVVVFTIHATLISRIEYGLAWSALAFGVFYLTLAYGLLRSGRDTLRLLAEAFVALGVIFASLAVPLAFDQQTTAAMWAVEGAGLLWIGVRQSRRLARAFGALLQLAGGIGYLAGLHKLSTDVAVLNSAFVGTLMLAVAGLCSGYWLFRSRATLSTYEARAPVAAGIWAVAWWLYGGLGEIDRAVAVQFDYGAALMFAAASILLLHVLAGRLAWGLLNRLAAAVLGGATVIGLAAGTKLAHPLAELGFLGWPALLGSGYGLLYRSRTFADPPLEEPLRWLHAGLYWSLALLLAWEASWQTGQQVAGVWQALPWGLAPALLLWAAARPLPFWPIATNTDWYRLQAGLPLAVWATLWVLALNVSHTGDPAWLPYVPLLNPMDIAVALVLVTLGYWWLSLTDVQRQRLLVLDVRVLWAIAAGIVFIWLNAALIRSLHHLFGTPWDLPGIRDSFLVQTSLSIFWGLLGLTAIGLAGRLARRTIWFAGAAMMGVVVVKLILIDLDGSGTLARIVSFLAVGALLLLAGYLSPLPPSTAPKEATA